jgi:NAD(P)-dependent dehydrogenase (short-subunit alcohol dehydrogenase family)
MPSDQLQGFADHLKTIVPAKRFGTADEMAKVVLFLASSHSSYLYGSDILADGGFTNI